MRAESSNLFDYTPRVDKNSREFDLYILGQLKAIKSTPEKFDTEVKKIMKQKSSLRLWWSNLETKIWSVYEDQSGGEYHVVNYRCCPESRKARSYFCLDLNRSPEMITVRDGWLESI